MTFPILWKGFHTFLSSLFAHWIVLLMKSLLGSSLLPFLLSLLLASPLLLSLEEVELLSFEMIFLIYYPFMTSNFHLFLSSFLNLIILLPHTFLNLILWMLRILLRWKTSWLGLFICILVMPLLLTFLPLVSHLILLIVLLFIPVSIAIMSLWMLMI